MDITVYTKPGCKDCLNAENLLRTKNLEFLEHDITQDNDARLWLKYNHSEVVPQVFINDVHVGGLTELKSYLA